MESRSRSLTLNLVSFDISTEFKVVKSYLVNRQDDFLIIGKKGLRLAGVIGKSAVGNGMSAEDGWMM